MHIKITEFIQNLTTAVISFPFVILCSNKQQTKIATLMHLTFRLQIQKWSQYSSERCNILKIKANKFTGSHAVLHAFTGATSYTATIRNAYKCAMIAFISSNNTQCIQVCNDCKCTYKYNTFRKNSHYKITNNNEYCL